MSRAGSRAAVFVWIIMTMSAAPPAAAQSSFDPFRHFPRDSWLFVDVDFGRFLSGFGESPLGRILAHPGIVKGLGRAPAILRSMIDSIDRGFEHELGMPPSRFFELFKGRAALACEGFDPRRGPEIYFVMEVDDAIANDALRITGLVAKELSRGEATTTKVRGFEIHEHLSTSRYARSSRYGIVRKHLVYFYGEDIEPLIDRITGRERGEAFATNAAFSRVRTRSPEAPIVTWYFGLGDFLEIMLPWMETDAPPPVFAQAKVLLAASGLDKVEAAAYELQLESGDWAGRLTVSTPGGASGLIGAIVESFGSSVDANGFASLPVSASSLTGFSFHSGRAARAVHEFITTLADEAPDLGGPLAAALAEIGSATGLDLRADLGVLPRIGAWIASVDAPLGGLIRDRVAIVRLDAAAPYLGLLDRVLGRLGLAATSAEVAGRPVARVDIVELACRLAGCGPAPGFPESLAIAYVFGGTSVSFTPLDDEWLLIASSSQAIHRYLDGVYGTTFATDDAATQWIRERARSASVFTTLRSGAAMRTTYNTLVGILQRAAPVWADELDRLGIEPAHFPPGEELDIAGQAAFVAFEATGEGFGLRTHGMATALATGPGLELLLPIAVAGGAVEWTAARRRREMLLASPEAAEAQIRALYGEFVEYASLPGVRSFPAGAATSLEAFQMLADSGVLDRTDLLVRPGAPETIAVPIDGRLELREENISYALVPWKQGPSDAASRLLAYEKKAYAGGGRWALFVRGDAKFLSEDAFTALLDEQTKRYGGE